MLVGSQRQRTCQLSVFFFECTFCALLTIIIRSLEYAGPNFRIKIVGGKLLKAVQSFYVDSRVCVRVGNDMSEWLTVNVGLRQGCCVMYIWMVWVER